MPRYRKISSSFDQASWKASMDRRGELAREAARRERLFDTDGKANPLGITLTGSPFLTGEERREWEALPNPVNGWAEQPRLVEAHEGEAPDAQLKAWLREGTLKGTDLVEVGGHWTTFADVPPYADALDASSDGTPIAGAGTWLLLAGIVLAVLGILALH